MRTCKHCNDEMPEHVRGYQCNTCRQGLIRYGLNKLDQKALLESQEHKCKLCGKEVELFNRRKSTSGYIDHCHKTNKVRAILCHPCNTALGYIENNLDLEEVKKYISL